MVDKERRNAIFKIGGGIAAVAGVGYGGYEGATWLYEEHKEWEEQRPPRPERWAREVESDVRTNGGGDGLYWEQTYVDVENIDVVYEQVGTSEAGAPRYRFTARAPLTGAPFDLCDYADSAEAAMDLAAIMERDSLKLYEEMYDQLGFRLVTEQDDGQPAVSVLSVQYVDETGEAGFAFDGRTAEAVAINDAFAPENFRDRSNFQQPYRADFAVRCENDG